MLHSSRNDEEKELDCADVEKRDTQKSCEMILIALLCFKAYYIFSEVTFS